MVGMTRKYTRYIHIKVTEEEYNMAKELAELCCEGRTSQLLRTLIREKYEQTIGKKAGDRV